MKRNLSKTIADSVHRSNKAQAEEVGDLLRE